MKKGNSSNYGIIPLSLFANRGTEGDIPSVSGSKYAFKPLSQSHEDELPNFEIGVWTKSRN
jgi:hypothetical protein